MGWGQKGKGQVSKQHIKPTRKPDTTSILKARKSSTNVSLAGHGIAAEVTSSGHDNQIRLLLLRGQGQAGDGGVPKEEKNNSYPSHWMPPSGGCGT